jgi:hypothetical protein
MQPGRALQLDGLELKLYRSKANRAGRVPRDQRGFFPSARVSFYLIIGLSSLDRFREASTAIDTSVHLRIAVAPAF